MCARSGAYPDGGDPEMSESGEGDSGVGGGRRGAEEGGGEPYGNSTNVLNYKSGGASVRIARWRSLAAGGTLVRRPTRHAKPYRRKAPEETDTDSRDRMRDPKGRFSLV